jgi:hypothetical protein
VEISDTIGSINVGPEVDDVDLEAELEELQQKELDDKMRETGTVPVLPAVANGESKLIPGGIAQQPNQGCTNSASIQGQTARSCIGLRGGGAQEVASRDGHVSVGTHFMAVVLRGAYPAPFQIWRASFPFASRFGSGELMSIYEGR